MKTPLSVTVLTRNSQKYLAEVLNALTSFDEVLICDTGSQDETLTIARKYLNVVIYERPFIGFGPTHNVASALAKNDWVLSVDSDEVLTPELVEEIHSLELERNTAYTIPRHNEYRKKWIKWCGWYPDRQVKLYNRLDTQFSEAQVHEAVETFNLRIVNLTFPLRHYSYETVSDFLKKMDSYTGLFAQQNCGKKSSSLVHAISHGMFAFFKSYFLKGGILGGREGFEISIYQGNTAFYKYLKLMDANEKLRSDKSDEEFSDGLKKKPIV